MATVREDTRPEPGAVFNVVPPLHDVNLYTSDVALMEAVANEGASWAESSLTELGRRAGTAEAIRLGVDANVNPPRLQTYGPQGNRIDEVEFHPAWHQLLEVAVGLGLHALPWIQSRPGTHVSRAAGFYLWSQVEAGHGCPISMTAAMVPALRAQAELAARWEPGLTSLVYDPGLRPRSSKRGLLGGMGMTERQGGSDVRTNTTRAVPLGRGGPGSEYRLTGHKWFCSAPMSDIFLVLAQAPEGLSCFLLPRVLEDGTRNAFHIQRLKDKLGNRSNASSEVEFQGAWAWLCGEPGRGVRVIVEMVNHTRLDCVVGSASGMRQALAQAVHHARHRHAFGKRLYDQPLMGNVLADLALESEAATAIAVRLAGAFDRAAHDPHEAAIRRLLTAVAKYWVCKRASAMIGEALECLGGNGYVEDSIMPRLYREAPLNSIWEGSGNVIALDAMRVMAREPESLEAFRDELVTASGLDPHFDAALQWLDATVKGAHRDEGDARRLTERLAVLMQAALLLRRAPAAVSAAYCRARLGREGQVAFGTLPAGADMAGILARALPE